MNLEKTGFINQYREPPGFRESLDSSLPIGYATIRAHELLGGFGLACTAVWIMASPANGSNIQKKRPRFLGTLDAI